MDAGVTVLRASEDSAEGFVKVVPGMLVVDSDVRVRETAEEPLEIFVPVGSDVDKTDDKEAVGETCEEIGVEIGGRISVHAMDEICVDADEGETSGRLVVSSIDVADRLVGTVDGSHTGGNKIEDSPTVMYGVTLFAPFSH